MTAESMADAALELAAAGWAVFPCREQDTPRAKKPYTEHGFKDATRENTQIVTWWARWPRALIGAAVPDSLLVLDIDPRNGGSVEALTDALGTLPATLTAWSGRGDGGRHLYYMRPGGALSSRLLPPGVDLKVNGYCIMAPSLHPTTGRPYWWERRPIVELPWDACAALRPPARVRRAAIAASTLARARQAAALVRSVQAAHDGRRNDVLYWAACRAFEEAHGEQLVSELERAALDAGLPAAEVARTVKSARDAHASPGGR